MPSAQPVQVLTVNVEMDGHVAILSPRDNYGREVMKQVLDAPEEARTWHFNGSRYTDSRRKEGLVGLFFACGGEYGREQIAENHVRGRYFGLIELFLDFSETEATEGAYALRNYGFFGGGVVVQPNSTPEAIKLVNRKECKVCQGPLHTRAEVEWKVCDNCSASCDHHYKMGVGQAAGNIAYLPFCQKCGRGDPNWQPSNNPLEDAAKTVTEGGLDMLFIDTGDQVLVFGKPQPDNPPSA